MIFNISEMKYQLLPCKSYVPGSGTVDLWDSSQSSRFGFAHERFLMEKQSLNMAGESEVEA